MSEILLQKPVFDPNKNYVVMWSGGLDSTYLLYYVCQYTPSVDSVKTISVSDHPQLNKEMLAQQKKARDRFTKYAEEEFNIEIDNIEIDVDTKGDLSTGGNTQSALWTALSLSYVDSDDDEIVYGYVRGDDFWHRKHETESAISSLLKVNSKNTKFRYPLEWTSKTDILYDWHVVMDLPDDMYWFCEEPVKDPDTDEVVPCGQCGCCLSHNKAIYEANFIEDDCDLNYVEPPDID